MNVQLRAIEAVCNKRHLRATQQGDTDTVASANVCAYLDKHIAEFKAKNRPQWQIGFLESLHSAYSTAI
jgi:hypothetical protein